jgi:hypothetical protein
MIGLQSDPDEVDVYPGHVDLPGVAFCTADGHIYQNGVNSTYGIGIPSSHDYICTLFFSFSY